MKYLKLLSILIVIIFLGCKSIKITDLKPNNPNRDLLPSLEPQVDIGSFQMAYSLGTTKNTGGAIGYSTKGSGGVIGTASFFGQSTTLGDKRIQDAITDAITLAQENGDVTVKDEFLYPKNFNLIVRRRTGDPPAKINLICDDEIVEAAKIVIRTQYASPMSEVVKQTSRLFGIKVTRGATVKRIEGVVQQLVEDGVLEVQSNGMINFPK